MPVTVSRNAHKKVLRLKLVGCQMPAATELKQRGVKKEENVEQDDTTEMVPEENDPITVELGDVQAVKTALDDSLVQVNESIPQCCIGEKQR